MNKAKVYHTMIKNLDKVRAGLVSEFTAVGGDVTTLDDPATGELDPCPKPNQIKNSKGECIDDPGVGR